MAHNKTNMAESDEFLKKILEKQKNDNKDDEGGGGAPNDEDDEQFRKKDEEMFERIKNELEDAKKRLEGILPESNQQRNLDRETGGLEVGKDKGISQKDIWDDRGKQIAQMIENDRDLNTAKSSRNKSFIHRKKIEKMHKKNNKEAAQNSFEEMGYVARLKNMRQDRTTLDSTGIGIKSGGSSSGGGRGM